MIIQLSPQVREFDKIWYGIEDQKITATINDISDTFDFTGMPDGELQMWDENDNPTIETELDEVPIISAKKENGELTVEFIFSIDTDEKDERLLFPEPMTLDEYKDLMDELAERNKETESDSEESEDVRDETEIIDIEEVDF